MYQFFVILVIILIYVVNYYKLQVRSNKYININKNCDIYSTLYIDRNINNVNNKNTDKNNHNSKANNITFVCPFPSLIKKTLANPSEYGELLVNFNDYYVYDEDNKLIDKVILNTSNTNLNRFIVCNQFPNKDCKTVFMYLVDSKNKSVSNKNKTNPNQIYFESSTEPTTSFNSDSSLIYNIDIINENIIKKSYDPNSNVYEVILLKSQTTNKEGSLDNKLVTDSESGKSNKTGQNKNSLFNTKDKEDLLLKVDQTNPNLTYELNGVKITESLTSLNSLKLDKNNLDNSYILISHNKASNKRSFLIIKLKYNTQELTVTGSGVLVKITRLGCSINGKTNGYDVSGGDIRCDNGECGRGHRGHYGGSPNSNGGDSVYPGELDSRRGDIAGNTGLNIREPSNKKNSAPGNELGVGTVDSAGHGSTNDAGQRENNINGNRTVNDPTTCDIDRVNHLENGGDLDEWLITDDNDEYEKFVPLGGCLIKIDFIVYDDNSGNDGSTNVHADPKGTTSRDVGKNVYLNGYKLDTNHYKLLVNSFSDFKIKYNNRIYKLAISDLNYDLVGGNKAPKKYDIGMLGVRDGTTIDYNSGDRVTKTSAYIRNYYNINIERWIMNFIIMVIWIFTIGNICLNISKFYFESINYITFLVLFYRYLVGSYTNVVVNKAANAVISTHSTDLINMGVDRLITRLLIYIDNSVNFSSIKLFLMLNLLYVVNLSLIMWYLISKSVSNFNPRWFKKFKRNKMDVLVLFNYLLLLMVLFFLKFDKNRENIYIVGRKFNSFYFNSITLILTLLMILIVYQLYPKDLLSHRLNNTLFGLIETDSTDKGNGADSLDNIYKNLVATNRIIDIYGTATKGNHPLKKPKSPLTNLLTPKHTSSKSAGARKHTKNGRTPSFRHVVDANETLSSKDSYENSNSSYYSNHRGTGHVDVPGTHSPKKDKVVINDKYRLLYINSVIIESSIVAIYYILNKSETGIYLIKFTFWLMISLYIQSLNNYYNEVKINKYLLIKALKYLVLTILIRAHVIFQNRSLIAPRGGFSGSLMAILILVCVNQCINHKSLSKLYKSIIKHK